MDTETLGKKLETTPEDIQLVLLHEQYGPEIFAICQEAGIEDEEALDVEDVVTYILLGEIKPKRFVPTLTKELGIPGNKARKIAREVYDSIFRSVEETLEEMYELQKPLFDVLEESMGADATTSQTQQKGQQEPRQPVQEKTQPSDTAPAQDARSKQGVQPTQQDAPEEEEPLRPRSQPTRTSGPAPKEARITQEPPTETEKEPAEEPQQKPMSRRERARAALSGGAVSQPEEPRSREQKEPVTSKKPEQPEPPENLPGQEPAAPQTRPQPEEPRQKPATSSEKMRPTEEARQDDAAPHGRQSVIDEKLRRAQEPQDTTSPAQEETRRDDPYREPIE